MPYFFLLGEMKCGTTTLYKKLSEHPQVVLPRNKEVRYLMQPKYRRHTATWYASNFDSVVKAPADAVTFDASPTSFNAQAIAPGWTAKWLPDARLIVMLRDPIQRTYSHFRMGVEWLKASKVCFTEDEGQMAPVPSIRVLLPNATSFAWQARVSVAETILRGCKHSGMGWAAKDSKDFKMKPLTEEQKACVLRSPAGEAAHAIIHAWQVANAARSDKELEILNGGEKAINYCSELMLRPGAGVTRSAKYADNMAGWLRWFPEEAVKVVATEKLETDFDATISDVVRFLQLRALPAAALTVKTRFCVTSKVGIMDEKRSDKEKAGVIGKGMADAQGVAECTSAEEKKKGADGITRYPIDSATLALLKEYFQPSNQKLYKVLGRDMGW